MKTSRFKIGDKVKTKGNSEAVVKKVEYVWGVPRITIQYEGMTLTAELDEEDLTFYHEDLVANDGEPVKISDKCPKCGTEWTVTNFGTKRWLDCKPCGKTAEKLCKDTNKKKPEPMDFDLWGYGGSGL